MGKCCEERLDELDEVAAALGKIRKVFDTSTLFFVFFSFCKAQKFDFEDYKMSWKKFIYMSKNVGVLYISIHSFCSSVTT